MNNTDLMDRSTATQSMDIQSTSNEHGKSGTSSNGKNQENSIGTNTRIRTLQKHSRRRESGRDCTVKMLA